MGLDWLHGVLFLWSIFMTMAVYNFGKVMAAMMEATIDYGKLQSCIADACGRLERGKAHEAFVLLKAINDGFKNS